MKSSLIEPSKLLAQALAILQNKPKLDRGLSAICQLLHHNIPHYHWVGFYFMHSQSRTLHLGPFAGAPTEHTRIPFGKGICGQVALSGKNYRSQDVQAENNYIACSIDTRSELVVPLFLESELVGQIDIDSHSAAAFDQGDEDFLQELNRGIAKQYAEEIRTKIKRLAL